MCVSSYYSICALNDECFCGYFGFSGATILLLCMRSQYLAASYYYIYASYCYVSSGLILLCMCPQTTIYLPISYYYMCVLILLDI